MSLQQPTTREIIVPYTISECVERIQALREERPSPRNPCHKVSIKYLDDDRIQFMVRMMRRSGSEEVRVTGFLTPQSDQSTHVEMKSGVRLMKTLFTIGLILYGVSLPFVMILAPGKISINIGVGLLIVIVFLTDLEFTASARRTLIEIVTEQLQEFDQLKKSQDNLK